MICRFILFLFLLLAAPALAQQRGSGAPPPDPFALNDSGTGWGTASVSGTTLRSQVYNPADRKLFLIVVGQSNCTSINPTAFIPASSNVDQFNVYDSGSYDFPSGQVMVGTQNGGINTPGGGPGNVSARVAQLFITNNIFDKVVVASVCVGSTTAAMWAGGATLYLRLPVVIKRALSRGVTPGSNGWTMAISWWLGETDNVNGTSSASYQASMATTGTIATNAGFVGRIFVNVETWIASATSATIQSAQAAVVTNNPSLFFTGGNIDTLNNTFRFDTTHLNDAGAASAATLVYNAMHASGSPF